MGTTKSSEDREMVWADVVQENFLEAVRLRLGLCRRSQCRIAVLVGEVRLR